MPVIAITNFLPIEESQRERTPVTGRRTATEGLLMVDALHPYAFDSDPAVW
jgi:hypothetical protein